MKNRITQPVRVGDLQIGAGAPVSVQSMCATKTQDIAATLAQIQLLQEHGADIVRVAVDSKRDVDALKQIRQKTDARLVVDLQESYRLVESVAPLVQKIRYNPGHLHHHEKEKPVFEKVAFIVEHARRNRCAIRIGVNFGSLAPDSEAADDRSQSGPAGEDHDDMQRALSSVGEHIAYMQRLEFDNYIVSLKSSDPNQVIEINRRFAAEYPSVPIHLGVTEAGMPPMGEVKTRVAFENLLAVGIGDTLRCSLTLPFAEKYKEILLGKAIVEDVKAGRFRSVPKFESQGLNIISCPSCSRVENEAFVELAHKVRDMTAFAAQYNLTIAVMGCRVNGPGESDDADLGLWCAPNHVNLKCRGQLIGAFNYDEIVPRLEQELRQLIGELENRAAP